MFALCADKLIDVIQISILGVIEIQKRGSFMDAGVLTRGSRTVAVTKSVLPGVRPNRRQYWGLTYGHRR